MTTTTDPTGDGFSVEPGWKEVVRYWEGSRGCLFDGAWGVSPPHLFVPDAATWDACVPDWMRGRRDEIVARLATHSRHDVVDSPTETQDAGRSRSLTR